LQRIDDAFAASVLLLQAHHVLEKAHAQQRRLAALPGERDFGHVLLLDVLPDIGVQHVVGHLPRVRALALVLVQVFLFQIKAVLAVQVADGPMGFVIT
jgi:hypothetical protein